MFETFLHNLKQHHRNALKSGLAYGLSLVLGNIIAVILFNIVTLDAFRRDGDIVRIIIGLLFAFVIMGIAGAIAGFGGGYTLEMVHRPRGRVGYAWRSALSFGPPFGLLIFPIVFGLSLLTIYNPKPIPILRFGFLFLVVGVVFGAVNGLLQAGLTTGRGRVGRVIKAGLIGFGLGGFGLGVGLHRYIYAYRGGVVASGKIIWVMLGLWLFGFLGGAAYGIVYSRMATETAGEPPPLTRRTRILRWTTAVLAIAFWLFVLRPAIAGMIDVITPQSANLAAVLDTNTIGTHWSDPATIPGQAGTKKAGPDIALSASGNIALVWAQEDGGVTTIRYLPGVWDAANSRTHWLLPAISLPANAAVANAPRVAVDAEGAAHLVWAESSGADASDIFTSRCSGEACTPPTRLSDLAPLSCLPTSSGAAANSAPAIAIDDADDILVTWLNGAGTLLYASWPSAAAPPATPTGCVPGIRQPIGAPRLAGGPGNHFVLAYADGAAGAGAVNLLGFSDGGWDSAPQAIGEGDHPDVFIDAAGRAHAAWCGDDGLVQYWGGANAVAVSDSPPCLNRPALAQDSAGDMHVLWYADVATNSFRRKSPGHFLYESILRPDGWSPPTIIARTDARIQPALASGADGSLHLTWPQTAGVQVAVQVQYDCEGYELSPIGQVVYDIARQKKYRPASAPIPYCQNRYDGIVFTPNPDPAFSEQKPTPNGGFDALADLAKTAQYEVLVSTMWYDKAENHDSPGAVLADAIAELYRNIEEDPARYPRGLTVRLLLGNPPEFAGGDFSNQIWSALGDLRDAGVDKMVDPAIGWRVEVADFEGTAPHSHSKLMVVDGKTAIAVGFNMSYEHFPVDHPSGKGNGRFDLGIHITGPVAQNSQRAFDDLWTGSPRRNCNFHPPVDDAWQLTCRDAPATSEHVPEVLRYDLPGGHANAFTMYRTEAHDEADQEVVAALAAAQESIDAIHVNFTMELVCDLNLLYNICTFDNVLPWMDSMLDAAENNGARIRVMIKSAPIDGIESSVAVEQFEKKLAERGIQDLVEIRIFDGPMHAKSTLIDDEFLIIGSQNYHYSAFGEGSGLTEYNMGTDDPQAVADYKAAFEYEWQRAHQLGQ